MRHRKTRGLSTLFFLALGIVIGVIIVVTTSLVIKSRTQAPEPSPPAALSPSPDSQETSEEGKEPDGSGDTAQKSDGAVRMDLVKDPVCGKLVNPNTDLKCQYKGREYYFCSDICIRSFKYDPLLYVDNQVKVNISIEPVDETPGAPVPAVTEEKPPQTEEPAAAPAKPAEPPSRPSEAKPPEHIARPIEAPAVRKPAKAAAPSIEEIPLDGTAPQKKPPKSGGSAEKPVKKSGPDLHIEEIPLE